jgi:hypothetical protein
LGPLSSESFHQSFAPISEDVPFYFDEQLKLPAS